MDRVPSVFAESALERPATDSSKSESVGVIATPTKEEREELMETDELETSFICDNLLVRVVNSASCVFDTIILYIVCRT